MGPKLSVIIPVHDSAKYLRRSMDSVLNQTLKDCEIIVVNDCSQDESKEIITEYQKKNSRVTSIDSASHIGTGAARNIGLSSAAGQYIAFLDADDWVDTDTYRQMCHAMDCDYTDIAVCGIRTEFGPPSRSIIRYQYSGTNTITGAFALKLLSKAEMQDAFISPMPGNKVFSATFLAQNRLQFPPRRLWEDDVFMFFSFLYARQVSIVPNVYQHYYQHNDSASHFFSEEQISSFLQAFCEMRDVLQQADLWEQYQVVFYSYMERGISSLLDVLFSRIQQVREQQMYIALLLEGLLKHFSIQELVSHMDPQRLQRIWL